MICIIASAGGHLQEAILASSLLNQNKIFYVTFSLPHIHDILKDKEYYLVEDPHLNKFKYIKNAIQVLFIYFKKKPHFIVTTGAGIAAPMCAIGKIFGSKIVFIESGARVIYPSRTSLAFHKLRLADLFIVQWKPLLKYFPDAIYGGPLI